MAAVESVLIIGAGAAGCVVAGFLAQGGVRVRVVDVKPDVQALGSGITVQGNALRVLRDLGVWGELRSLGYEFSSLGMRAPDPQGTLVAEFPDARTGGDDLPATLGIYRPELARVVTARARDLGATVDFGVTVTALEQSGDAVDVTFADGSTERYDLVVGADGIRSWTRRAVGIDAEPRRTGMGIWRVFAPRPASVTRTDLIYGGRCYIAGYCPTGEDSLYAYVVEDYDDAHAQLTPEEGLQVMLDLASHYHGPWDEIREGMTEPSRINYTKFETHVVDAPWHRGRVVLAGDAAHSCPPTLAQGAAQAFEDAAVLAELLLAGEPGSDIEATLTAYSERRIPRARAIVDASVQLGDWLLAHEQGDMPGLIGRTSAMLAQRP